MAKVKNKSHFVCQNCGAQRSRWEGRCSDCGEWNTFLEEVSTPDQGRGWSISTGSSAIGATVTLDQNIEAAQIARATTGFQELDRVLGGGLVPGSFILLGGDPGIGKSTLLMQMAGGIARNGKNVLYISGEESVSQTGLRAQRLGVRERAVEIASEANMDVILEMASSKKPNVLIVDSIQTVYLPQLDSAPGSVSQVRECAGRLMTMSKGQNVTVFLIGHVTKEGNIAGPKVLEHMVDTVLSFEGDQNHQFRLLRALKNRFGATHELGVFQMETSGLAEVMNPSELFLEERASQQVGSTVFASMEGTRPLLCEVQALAIPSPMPMPRRTSVGFDVNRVHLLVAVLSKHLSGSLAQSDIFVNVVGGLKLIEPAADLAVAAALLSTQHNIEVTSKTCFFGEMGLTGEVRAVSFAEHRIKEAQKLGFEKFIVPKSNRKHLDLPESEMKSIQWVANVGELAHVMKLGKTKAGARGIAKRAQGLPERQAGQA